MSAAAIPPLYSAVRSFIRRNRLLAQGEKVLIAVSGGIDSMVLLDLLDDLRREWMLELAVVHLNHQLRGRESDGDEEFVRMAAQRRGLPCYVHRESTATLARSQKQSIQEAAREVRYAYFDSLRVSLRCHAVATAHHADDNAETLLFNVFRGAGVNGLSGIPVARPEHGVIRPLLFAQRSEILAYAKERGLRHREDSSNARTDYTRNFLRHTIIPKVREEINPNLTATLLRTSELFTQLEEFLRGESLRIRAHLLVRHSDRELVLDAETLLGQPIFLQEYLLLHEGRTFSGKEIDFGTVREMLKIASGETGDSCSVEKGIVFYRNRNHLIFRRLADLKPFRYAVKPDEAYDFGDFRFGSSFVASSTLSNDPYTEYVDAASVGDSMILRTWQDGDRFVPLGMAEEKKLSDFFIDEKIPLFEKGKVPILESEGRILWVCGRRLDDRCKLSSTTEQILKLDFQPREHCRG